VRKDPKAIIVYTLNAIKKWPILITPLIFCWSVYLLLILKYENYTRWNSLEIEEMLLYSAVYISILSFVLSFSCLWLLELIQQIETKGKVNIFKALYEMTLRDVPRAFPIMLLWAFLWVFFYIVSLILSRFRSRHEDDQPYMIRKAANSLMGRDIFSLSGIFFRILQKALRMIVFLIFPAVAWENMNPNKAILRGAMLLKGNLGKFVTGYILTDLAALIVYFPAGVLLLINQKLNIPFPEWLWIGIFVYVAFAWSLSMLLEQLYTAELFIWNCKWEKARSAVKKTKGKRPKLPALEDIRPPSLLNNINDLEHTIR